MAITKQRLGLLPAVLLTIAAVPGIGISTLVLLLAHKNKPRRGANAPANERGHYG